MLATQRESPEIAQWTAADYEGAAQGTIAAWVAEDESGVVGFLIARFVLEEIEILNFAVRPEVRRRGAGSKLLAQVIEDGENQRVERVMAEVRASNVPALGFYETRGFRVVGRRPRYYSRPEEDALLLERPVECTRRSQPRSTK